MLSIVIPTYNRGNSCHRIVKEILATGFDGEIIISDNHSPVPVDPINGATIVYPPEHIGTAEEHFAWASAVAKGSYVWICGDDEHLNRAGFIEALKILSRGTPPHIIVFNPHAILETGTLRTGGMQCTDPERISSIEDFVCRAGLWTTLGGISNTIFKKPTRDEFHRFYIWSDISKIYSHSAWFVDIFKGRPFEFCTTPIVNFNIPDSNYPDKWTETFNRLGVHYSFPWTTGYARTINALRYYHGKDFLRDILSCEWGGTRTKASLVLAKAFYDVYCNIDPNAVRSIAVSDDEYADVMEFLTTEEPLLAQTDINRCLSAIKSLDLNPYHSNFVTRHKFFDIYEIHNEYFAIAITHYSKLSLYMSDITPTDMPYFFTGRTLYEVKLKIVKSCSIMIKNPHISRTNDILSSICEAVGKLSVAQEVKKQTVYQIIKSFIKGIFLK